MEEGAPSLSITIRSWKNCLYFIGGALFALVGLAGVTDDGGTELVSLLLLAPVIVLGCWLAVAGVLVGARRVPEGVRVRGVVRSKVLPSGSVANVEEAEMDMLPISYSRVIVTMPDGSDTELPDFAQYSFIERRRGGVQKKADRLNVWFDEGSTAAP